MKTDLSLKIILVVIFSLNSLSVFSQSCQWTQIAPGDCYRLVRVGNNVLYITRRNDILRSMDNGLIWNNANWPAGISIATGATYTPLNGGIFMVGSIDDGVWMSADTGSTFFQTGISTTGCSSEELLTLLNGSVLGVLHQVGCGMYHYTQNSWQFSEGFTIPLDYVQKSVDTLYAVSDGYLLLSTNLDNGWVPVNFDLYRAITIKSDSLYLLNSSGELIVAEANTQTGVNLPNPRSTPLLNGLFNDIEFIPNTNILLALEENTGLYISYDFGFTWNNCPVNGATNYYKITNDNNLTFVGTNVGLYSINLITDIARESKSSLLIYPNPVNSYLIVNSIELVSTIEIIDVLGNKLKEEINFTTNFRLDLSFLRNGIYFIRFYGEKKNTVSVYRIVKI